MPWLGRGIRTIQMVSPLSALQAGNGADRWDRSANGARIRRDGMRCQRCRNNKMARQHGQDSRGPSQRQLRVGETVRKELSDILTRDGSPTLISTG